MAMMSCCFAVQDGAISERRLWVFVSEGEMANVRRVMFVILLADGLDLVEAISCRVFGSLC